ncbi:MAG: hypothetical protein QXJ32_02610 [Thermoplasmata archaeon]
MIVGFASSMALSDITSLTSKERILLYLSDFLNMEDRYELPQELTQEVISYATGVQRKHLSQYLDDLLSANLVVERKAHIHGMRQRMNGYYLTPAGYAKARELRERVEQSIVPIKIDGQVREMKVAEIDDSTSAHISLCDIVREAIRAGSLDMASLESLEKKKREAVEAEEEASEVYKRALQTAWRDGRVTATERFLVEELRKHLKISEEQHRILEEEIVRKLAQDHMEFRRIYRAVLEIALADRVIEGPEEAILETLRKMMRISRREHAELFKEVEEQVCGPPGCDKESHADPSSFARGHAG